MALSRHDGQIDFAALRKKGFRFVYLKVTQGLRSVDPMAASYAAAASKAGVAIVLYHFFDPAADPIAQADNFVRMSRGLGATLPPLADFKPARPGQVIDASYGDRALNFLPRVKQNLSTTPAVYTARNFGNEHLDQRFGAYPLFLSDFSRTAHTSAPTMPKWWTQLTFWDVAAGVQNDPALRNVEIVAYRGDVRHTNFKWRGLTICHMLRISQDRTRMPTPSCRPCGQAAAPPFLRLAARARQGSMATLISATPGRPSPSPRAGTARGGDGMLTYPVPAVADGWSPWDAEVAGSCRVPATVANKHLSSRACLPAAPGAAK